MKKFIIFMMFFSKFLIGEDILISDMSIGIKNNQETKINLKGTSKEKKEGYFIKEHHPLEYVFMVNPEIDFGYKYLKFNLSMPVFPKPEYDIQDPYTSIGLGFSAIQYKSDKMSLLYGEIKHGVAGMYVKCYFGLKAGITNRKKPYYGVHITLGPMGVNVSSGIDFLTLSDQFGNTFVEKKVYIGFSLGFF